MARSHARVQVAIWQDPEFIRLEPEPQRLYLFLLSQPNLSHLGVLPLTLRRWSQTAAGYDVEQLVNDLAVLRRTSFVVVDSEAEELLIRTLLRNDGVYKQPNVLRGAIASAPAVHSTTIKRALLREIERIDLTEVSEEKGRRGEARTLLESLSAALSVPDGDPSGTRAETPDETLPEGFPEGFGDLPTHTRAQPLVLTPTTYPYQEDTSSPLRDDAPPGFAEWWAEYPRKVGKQAAIKAYSKALKKTDAGSLLDAVTDFAHDPNLPSDRSFICHPATWLNEGRWDDEPLPERGLRAVPTRAEQGDAMLRGWYQAATEGQQFELGAGA